MGVKFHRLVGSHRTIRPSGLSCVAIRERRYFVKVGVSADRTEMRCIRQRSCRFMHRDGTVHLVLVSE